jgi:hypothetical protein
MTPMITRLAASPEWSGEAVSGRFGLLRMIVSMVASFLSTFVMISQNRADAKR